MVVTFVLSQVGVALSFRSQMLWASAQSFSSLMSNVKVGKPRVHCLESVMKQQPSPHQRWVLTDSNDMAKPGTCRQLCNRMI